MVKILFYIIMESRFFKRTSYFEISNMDYHLTYSSLPNKLVLFYNSKSVGKNLIPISKAPIKYNTYWEDVQDKLRCVKS